MELVVVTVPDCPNAPMLEARLAQALAETGATGVATITRPTVSDAEQAARWQMRGSPTLLIDGRDPFADPATPTSLACRMYRDEQGRLEGAPSVPALAAALHRALGRAPGGTPDQTLAHADGPAPSESVPEPVPVWANALGRAGTGRAAPVEGGLRAVHQQMLRGFAETGAAPQVTELTRAAAPYGVSAEQVLAELHAADFLRLDDAGTGPGRSAPPTPSPQPRPRTGCRSPAGQPCSRCARLTRSASPRCWTATACAGVPGTRAG